MSIIQPYSRYAIIAMICVILFSGCLGDEVDPRPGSGQINIYYHDVDANEGDFFLNVTVDIELYVEETVTFDSVMGCAYNSSGSLIVSERIGSFTTPADEAFLQLETTENPQYIIIHHPDFEEYPAIETLVLDWNEERMNFERSDLDDLPFNFSDRGEVQACHRSNE